MLEHDPKLGSIIRYVHDDYVYKAKIQKVLCEIDDHNTRYYLVQLLTTDGQESGDRDVVSPEQIIPTQ